MTREGGAGSLSLQILRRGTTWAKFKACLQRDKRASPFQPFYWQIPTEERRHFEAQQLLPFGVSAAMDGEANWNPRDVTPN